VFDQKYFGGRCAVCFRDPTVRESRVHTDNTSGNQIGKGQRILASDPRVQGTSMADFGEETKSRASSHFQKLCQRCNGRHGGAGSAVSEPRNPRLGIDQGGIEQHRALGRQKNLESGNVFEVTPQHAQPIKEPVARDLAECKRLMKAWTEGPQPELMVQSVREEVGGRAAESCRRGFRCLREGEVFASEDGVDSLSYV